ncbi:MAG: hypothetical protein JWQ51_2117 [Tardiphaga sp.]|nr:hypothetical protein [Tardiphaga sp.]
MDWTHLLFSFRGRINRGKYWLAILIYTVAWVAFVGTSIAMIGSNTDDLFKLAGAGLLIWLAGLVLLLVGTWSGFATGIKRLHDRDKSGWWILLFWLGPSVLGGIQATTNNPAVSLTMGFGSAALAIWGLIELGVLRGSAGPNLYGRDPLTAHEPAPQR